MTRRLTLDDLPGEDVPLRLAKRLLTRTEAATYCSLTPSAFDHWLRQGRLPKPLPGTRRWDRKAIDRDLDRLSGLTDSGPQDDDFQAWLRREGHHAG